MRILANSDVSQNFPVITWNGTRYVAAWEVRIGNPSLYVEAVRGRLLDAGGKPVSLDTTEIAAPRKYQEGPNSIASSGADVLVTAGQSYGFACTISGDELEPGERIPLDWQWVAFDGVEYINAPGSIAVLGMNSGVIGHPESIKMLPASHNGGVMRGSLRWFGGRTRAVHFGG